MKVKESQRKVKENMKILCTETYRLIPEGVDAASDKMEEILDSHTDLSKKDMLRARLSMEEILLNWMQTDEGQPVLFRIERQGKKLNISLELQSPYRNLEKNPLKSEEDYGSSSMTESIMANLGMTWMYQMEGGVNRVFIRIAAKKANQLAQVAAAIALAAACGTLFHLLPGRAAENLSRFIIDPLFETFLGFLSAIVVPMMFLSVVWGVANIGGSRQLGFIGKKISFRFLWGNGEAALLGGVLLALFFPVGIQGGGGGEGQLAALADMLFDIVPDNLLSPFISGNTMQIIFLALIVGVTMVNIQNQVPLVMQAVEQCNAIIQQVLSVISRMVPLFVFLSVIRLVLMGNLGDLSGFAKMILLYLAGSAALIGYYLFLVWRQLKTPPVKMIKKLMPTYLIALSTASSAAAFSECTSACTEKLGIKKTLVNFGIPLGIVVYMPNYAMWLVLFAGACAQYYGQVLTLPKVFILLFMAVFLAVAAPPIPGGALTCYTILLMQMNIPLEMLAIASAINVVVDFTGTAGHLFANQTKLLIAGAKMGMVDRKILEQDG